jgi:GT2 family glycosyltransferase
VVHFLTEPASRNAEINENQPMPKISVIIANWNGKTFLADCLASLGRQTFRDFETILVDNGSSDGSADFVRAKFPEVRMVELADNRGFTGGNIAGYEHAKGELITLLNNDTEADCHWLEALYRASQIYLDAGSFASKMMYFDDRTRIENCGFDVGIGGATLDLGRDELDSAGWILPRKVFGACGGAAAYRRGMLDDIGFLDPDFFLIYEDVDLSFRAQLRGYSCVFVPEAIVYHRYRKSIGNLPARPVFFSQRNIEFVYLKNMPLKLMLQWAPQRLVYELGSAVYFARRGSGLAFWQAKLHALRSLPMMLRKRREIQRKRTVGDTQLASVMNKSLLSGKWKKFCDGSQTCGSKKLDQLPEASPLTPGRPRQE